jgi:hypothetical protein
MARISIDLKLSDLEPEDTIQGYTADRLVRFAMAVNKAGITDGELKEFCHDVERITTMIETEFERSMRQAFIDSLPDSIRSKYDSTL